jgi:aminomethyltransferase
MMIPNAGMGLVVTAWLNDIAEKQKLDAEAEDVSQEYVILAVQGPKSKEMLQTLTKVDLSTVKFFGCRLIKLGDIKCIISHTGYTGELGFELEVTPPGKGEQLFQKILKTGKSFGIKPIGLGARDTLRLEKGFILAGNEFEGGRTPLEATLSWTINWEHEFIGKKALLKQKKQKEYERLTCLKCVDKGVPRHGCDIVKDEERVGIVTSGTLSPCLNTGIAMGYVRPQFREVDTELEILVRDKLVKAKVMKPPFVPKNWVQQA